MERTRRSVSGGSARSVVSGRNPASPTGAESARAVAAARRILAVGLALCALSACSLSDSAESLGTLTTEPIQTRTTTRFGDFDPVDFGSRHPGLYPVHGIDVSKYQGEIDWRKVRRAGVSYAFLKATEGGDRVDDRFAEYSRGARAAGIPTAPYHFYYFCTPARVQAAWYIANVPRESVRMPPVLDMEWNPASPSCKLRPDPETVRSEMKIWLDIVERHYGKRPIIYTTVDFHRQNLDGHFRNHQFWLRSVAAHPDTVYPEHPWTFWQYTGTGKMPGIEGATDINAFAGTASQWQEWLRRHGS